MNFAHLYKSAAETNVKLCRDEKIRKSNSEKLKSNLESPQQTQRKRFENSTEENFLNNVSSKKARKKDKAKSVPINNDSDNSINTDMAEIKPKKRNKSVSFMLDDKEEVAVKKTKSDTSANDNEGTNDSENNPKKSKKKIKNKTLVKIENGDVAIAQDDIESNLIEKTKNLKRNISVKLDNEDSDPTKRNMNKKSKKYFKGNESGDSSTEKVNLQMTTKSHELIENKMQLKEIEDIGVYKTDKLETVEVKKSKKKKYLSKVVGNNVTESEPAVKSKKNEDKPEVIAENLENLSIGDNTHTLSNLLDEMTVVDKQKQKKNKIKIKQEKKPVTENTVTEIEGSKEKEKWKKKRWNKGNKGKDDTNKGLHPVIIENIPINLVLSYKKLLTERFSQSGTVRRVGIAEVYPSENTKPVFSTTVYFDSVADVTKALEEDNTSFEGTTIRVKRPFPPTETTAVVRSYGPLTEQIISSIFSGAGRIRRIRHLVKGKKSMATAFVELDEPEAVERAIKLADEVKVGGKNIHVTKFKLQRINKKKKNRTTSTAKIDENKKPADDVKEEDSDNSID